MRAPLVHPAPDHDALVVGEALIDEVVAADGAVREHPGGSPANVAVTLGRLGRRPRLATQLGRDDRGRRVREWLSASGVVLARGCEQEDPTSVATCRLGADGGATYDFALTWSPDLSGVGTAPLVHVGSIATLLEPGAGEVLRLLERSRETALVTYDPNVRPTICPDREAVRHRVEQFVGLADVVKVSDEDLAWLYPGEGAMTVLRRWATAGPAAVVVTRGAEGSVLLAGESCREVPGRSVDVVDTIGAGDSFMGALIHGLLDLVPPGAEARTGLRGASVETLAPIVEFAGEVAAVTVARAGANPPWRHEVAA
ncbi:carbohydrate kinase [Isoptericola sediminis]|uniref:carbohydrate kinase family protein n=1 Tax=Isoptericola sediminis TaxID=2733572 RepID=UPI0031B5A9A9